MSYLPKYTDIGTLQTFLQMEFTHSSRPSVTEVIELIRLHEREVDNAWLGWEDGASYGTGYLAQNKYIDVPEDFDDVLYLEYPVTEISSLHMRVSELASAPEWKPLKMGYYQGWVEEEGTDFMPLEDIGPDRQRWYYALNFYGQKPKPGKASLKMTFRYTYGVPATLLKEYVTLKVAIDVANIVVASGEPTRIAGWTGENFQTFVNTQLTAQVNEWKRRIAEIEEHFPKGARTY